MNLTKAQVKEVLERQRWYAQHFYYGPDAAKLLGEHTIEHGGRRFGISIDEVGRFVVVVRDSELRIAYEVEIKTAPVTHGIDNLDLRVRLVDPSVLGEADLKWAHEVEVFVLSCFQRTVAFVFLARAHNSTIERVASDLVLLNSDETQAV